MDKYAPITSPDGVRVPDQVTDFPPCFSWVAFGPAVRGIAQLACDIGRERPNP